MSEYITVGKRKVQITNRDSILFTKGKISKGDLIDYYEYIAPIMIPYLKQRPLTMHRFPRGIAHEGFYQKNAGDYFPAWVKRVRIAKLAEGTVDYVLCNNAATLVYLANQACITPHIWLSRLPKLDNPDRMIFDLDPGAGVTFAQIKKAARRFKDLLEQYDIPHFVMTTGSRGLHVVVPLKKTDDFDDVRDVARRIAQQLAHAYPDELTIEMRKAKRGKRIFIDYLRNAWAQTSVAPYAVRAKPGAPIATPLSWEELFDQIKTSQAYTITTIRKRIEQVGDLWHDIDTHACSLKRIVQKVR